MLGIPTLCSRVCEEHISAALDEMDIGGASISDVEVYLLARLFEMAGPAVRLILERAAEAGDNFDRKHTWGGIKNDKIRAWVEAHDNPYRVVDFIKRLISRELQDALVERGTAPARVPSNAERIAARLGGGWTSRPFDRGR